MAASALVIGLRMDPAQSLPLGSAGKVGSPDAIIQLAQQQGKEMGPGMGGQRPSQGPGVGGQQGLGQGGGGPSMQGGGKLRQGGSQFRPGERGTRGGEFGFRERGDRRHFGGRGGVYFGPSYGFLPASCNWLRRRALATDSPYWWRRYRACRAGW
jgi:hypothetical protein